MFWEHIETHFPLHLFNFRYEKASGTADSFVLEIARYSTRQKSLKTVQKKYFNVLNGKILNTFHYFHVILGSTKYVEKCLRKQRTKLILFQMRIWRGSVHFGLPLELGKF